MAHSTAFNVSELFESDEELGTLFHFPQSPISAVLAFSV